MKKNHLLFFLFCLANVALLAQQPQPLEVSFGNLRARSIGPAVMSGRVSDVDGVDTGEKIILYVGAAGGGLWKSSNGGASFIPVFDDYCMSIGKVAIDPQHPDTVWAGTGESWVRNSTSVGCGLYRTVNGGKTWQLMGLEDSERISDILIDPTNPAVIYVAVQGALWGASETRGVYKSTDFGESWQRILYVNEHTGAADLAISPDNPKVLFAAMWEHQRTPYSFRSGGPGSGLYRSEDGGASWQKLDIRLSEDERQVGGILGRMAIAIAPSNAQHLYLTIEAEKEKEKGLYASYDGGQSWKMVNNSFGMKVRPFYFSRLVVDPADENKVYKCGLFLSVSNDGGNTFRQVGSGVHSDVHAVWVNPRDSRFVVIGTDGGAYRSLDKGYTFEMFMDLPISQFYQVSADDAKPYNVYGGLQDNGSWYGPSRASGGVQNKDWDISHWGDGFYSFRHPTDPDIIYSESQEGGLVRFDKRDKQRKDIAPKPESKDEPAYRYNWNAPVHISPSNPERLYFACQFLFVTEDRGDSWRKISPDLTTNDPSRQQQEKSGGLSIDNSGAENNTTIYCMAESPKNEQLIWVGTDDGLLQYTSDGGQHWQEVASNIPDLPPNAWCSSVEPSPFEEGVCFVTFDAHRQGDQSTYIYKTEDFGRTWTSLATEQVEGYAHVIKQDVEAENLLFLGTEFGLYISLDGGLSWKRFSNNLPRVSVRSLYLQQREKALVIGTHGRGIYIIDHLEPLRQLTAEVAASSLAFFDLGPAYIQLPGLSEPFGGSGQFRGENPPEVALISYYMRRRHTFGKMFIEVYDPSGKKISTLPAGKSAGINMVALPLRLPPPKAAPSNNSTALFGSFIPPALEEGTYTVKIVKGRDSFNTNLVIAFDPDAAERYPAEDRRQARELQMLLYQLTEDMGTVYYGLDSLEQVLESKISSGEYKGRKLKNLKALHDEIATYKGSLVALEGDFYVNQKSYLREEISELAVSVSQYPGKPSESQVKRAHWLAERMKESMQRYRAYLEQTGQF